MTVQPQACPSLEATANRLTGYKGVQVDQGVKKLGEDLRGCWEQADGQVLSTLRKALGDPGRASSDPTWGSWGLSSSVFLLCGVLLRGGV